MLKYLFVALSLVLLTGPTANAGVVDPAMKGQVDLLNEFSERRRANTFFENEQSIFNGLQTGYVNVGTGNLTFLRKDLVTVGRIPLVFARVYDSSKPGSMDFSAGWRISVTETIVSNSDGSLSYVDDSFSELEFVLVGREYLITPQQPSDIQSLIKSSDGYLVTLRNQWTKRFVDFGSVAHLVEVTDNNGNAVQLDYDASNRLVQIRGEAGRHISIERYDSGQVSTITDNEGRSVVYEYDGLGRLVRVKDLGGNRWIYKYTAGRLKEIIDPKGNQLARFSYFANGKVRRTNVRHVNQRFSFRENLTIVTDEFGRQTEFKQNQRGITTKIRNAEGLESEIVLSEDNRVLELKHNELLRGEFFYDHMGRLQRMRRFDDFGEVILNYQVDWHDRIVEVTGSNGALEVLTYDTRGNLVRKLANDQDTQYEYDQNGDLLLRSIDGNSTTFTYNEAGLLTQQQNDGRVSQFVYDNNGRLSRITFPDGNEHDYNYDLLGFRTSTSRSGGSYRSYQYDPAGNLIEITGRGLTGGEYTENFELDEDNQVTRIGYGGTGQFEIEYDRSGNPITLDWGNQTMSCAYDAQGRLVSVDDSVHGQSTYQYEQFEPDIRKQLDDRTFRTLRDERRASNSLSDQSAILYVRSNGTPWQVVAWNQGLALLDLPHELGVLGPESVRVAADKRRLLNEAMAIDEQLQPQFDRASNVFFLPPEYASANCEIGTFGTPYISSIPSSAYAGVAFSITAAVGWKSQNCGPLFFEFYANGTYKGGAAVAGLSHTQSITIDETGPVDIVIWVLCVIADSYIKYAFGNISIQSPCGSSGLVDAAALTRLGSYAESQPYEAGAFMYCVNDSFSFQHEVTNSYSAHGDRCSLPWDPPKSKTNLLTFFHSHPYFTNNSQLGNCSVFAVTGLPATDQARAAVNLANQNFSENDREATNYYEVRHWLRGSHNLPLWDDPD